MAGKEGRKPGLDICGTGFGNELGGMEKWDGSHETYQFWNPGILT